MNFPAFINPIIAMGTISMIFGLVLSYAGKKNLKYRLMNACREFSMHCPEQTAPDAASQAVTHLPRHW